MAQMNANPLTISAVPNPVSRPAANPARTQEGAPREQVKSFDSSFKSEMRKRANESSGDKTKAQAAQAGNGSKSAENAGQSKSATQAQGQSGTPTEADAASRAGADGTTDAATVPDTVAAADLAALLPMLANALPSLKGPGKSTQAADGAEASTEGLANDLPATMTPQPAAPVIAPELTPQVAAAANTAMQTANANSALPGDEALTDAAAIHEDLANASAEKFAVKAANAADKRDAGLQLDTSVQREEFHAFMERAVAMPNGTAQSANAGAASATTSVNTPVGHAGWADEMGQKLTWMANAKSQQAELVLTPPSLGRVEVSLTLNGDQASVVFTSANPNVREALEDSMQRLREVLADAGVNLGQAQVGSESPKQFAGHEGHGRSGRQGGGHGNEGFGLTQGLGQIETIPAPRTAASGGRSMVDLFA